MNKIETLDESGEKEVMVFMFERDDGLSVFFCHGRMQWYRSDTKMPVDVYNYSYWK